MTKKYSQRGIVRELMTRLRKIDDKLNLLLANREQETTPGKTKDEPPRGNKYQPAPGDKKLTVNIYTDGSCTGSNGGWAYTVSYSDGNAYECSGKSRNTTNNRMEMTAAIEALDNLKFKGGKLSDVTVNVYSDSKYLVDGITSWIKNWKANGWVTGLDKKEVKNRDLWEKLDEVVNLYRENGITLEFKWVKGHSGNAGNTSADKLAREEMRKASQLSML